MGTTLNVNLDIGSIKNAIKELNAYKESLEDKTKVFTERLLERGIAVAKEHSVDTPGLFGTHHMGKYVTFEKQIESNNSSCEGILLGIGETVFSKISEGRSMNALLAIEFGTAALGLPPWKGTNSLSGHGDDLIWYSYYKDESGKKHRVQLSAMEPTRPLYHAAMEMRKDIVEVAQEVFMTDREISC